MKIDDVVKTVGPDRLGNYHYPQSFQISMTWKDKGQNFYSNGDLPWYPESSLELIGKPKIELTDEIKAKIGKAVWEKMDRDEDRFVAIEKQISYQKAANGKLRKRCHDLEEWREKHLAARDLVITCKDGFHPLSGETVKIHIFSKPDTSAYASQDVKILDDGLQKGDWAIVTNATLDTFGKIGKIASIDESKYPIQFEDRSWYKRSSLRKLTDVEIAERLNREQA